MVSLHSNQDSTKPMCSLHHPARAWLVVILRDSHSTTKKTSRNRAKGNKNGKKYLNGS